MQIHYFLNLPQFVQCAVCNFCSFYVEGKMEVYGIGVCLFVNLKLFPVKSVLIFLLISFFKLGIDLILVNHQHESSNGRSFFIRVNLEQTF